MICSTLLLLFTNFPHLKTSLLELQRHGRAEIRDVPRAQLFALKQEINAKVPDVGVVSIEIDETTGVIHIWKYQ